MSTEFEANATIEASPETVWTTLSDLAGISQWAAIIAESPVVGKDGLGSVRNCTFPDGTQVQEEFIGWQENRLMRYTITGDLPVTNMVSTWSLEPKGDTTVVTYHGRFDAPSPDMAVPLQQKLGGMAGFLLEALKTNVETGQVLAPPAV